MNTNSSAELPFSPRPTTISQPNDTVPAHATYCHIHIFGPFDRFPLSTPRMYNPQEATVADEKLERMHQAGVRGIRFNVISGGVPIENLSRLAERTTLN